MAFLNHDKDIYLLNNTHAQVSENLKVPKTKTKRKINYRITEYLLTNLKDNL